MPASSDLEILGRLVAAVKELEGIDATKALTGAPLLVNWHSVEPQPHYVQLVGTCSGHPSLTSGHIFTSRVLYIDPNLEWARTANRYYRLRDPAPTDLGKGLILTDVDGKPIRPPEELQTALHDYRKSIL